MRKLIRYSVILLLISAVAIQCVEPFEAGSPALGNGILVIDGYINAGPGESVFQLSVVSPLDDTRQIIVETGAQVTIENDDDLSFPLIETGPGKYTSGELNLPAANRYRLHIILKNNKEYRSEFVQVKVTPVIDSLHWDWSREKGLDLYVNSHDAQNETHYYQWQFREDWQIRPPYVALLTYANDTIVERDPQEVVAMYNCWRTSQSNDLIFTSTENKTNDVVKFRLVNIPASSDKISVKYSIIVKQHTLSDEHYTYQDLMMKNSTDVGSWFDAMPTELSGNVINIAEPSEMVVGFVGAYTTEETIFFIRRNEVPFVPTQEHCATEQFEITPANLQAFLGANSNYVPYETFLVMRNGLTVPMVKVIERSCIDCRVFGNNERPVFWD